MHEHSQLNIAPQAPRLPERRRNRRKRSIVDSGVSVGQENLISGVEYLQSREIEASIIMRVLLELLADRLPKQ
jgi:hypothetical protein